MKTLLSASLVSLCTALTAGAQVQVEVPQVPVPSAVVVPAPASGTTTTVTTSPAPPTQVIVNSVQAQPRTVDRVVVQGHLSVAPKVVITPQVTVTTPATTTTTTVETTRPARRVYNVERKTVTVVQNNETVELPYATLPVLFVVDTAELLDDQSRAAIQEMAGVITEISRTNPNAVFDVEGHTSTEGTDEHNMQLSTARAQRVYDELTRRYGVPASALSAHGYGENFPQYPNGTEDQLQLDRRVLVVRAR